MSAHSPSAAEHGPTDEGTTDNELGRNLLSGMIFGTPVLYATVVMMCAVAGISLGIALSVALLPAFFGGVFFGGIVPLLRQCTRQEHAQDAARRLIPAVPATAGDIPATVVPAVT